MTEQAAVEDWRTFLLFQLLRVHKTYASGIKKKPPCGVWQVTAVNLRQVPGNWESDVLILQFGQLRPKAGISPLQGVRWGSDTTHTKAEVSELIAWVFPVDHAVLIPPSLLPPLECGTNRSECQCPACQHVFWVCILPELAMSNREKKKSFVLNNTRNQQVLCSFSDIQRQPMNEAMATTWTHPFPPEVVDNLGWSLTNMAASSLTTSLWTQEGSLEESHEMASLLHSGYGLWVW